MCARLWRQLGISNLRLEIGTLGSVASRAVYRDRLIGYFEQHLQHLDEDARRRLYTNPLRILDSKNPAMREVILNAPRLLDDLDEESLVHFKELQDRLQQQGIDFEINLKLVRGLDYYNRTVFEWITDKLGAQGTVCAGGRYDGLIEQMGGKHTPACGFAMGIERILALMNETGVKIHQSEADAYVVYQGEMASKFCWKVAEYFRDNGLKVILHCGGGNFKSQMKKADASGARFAIIIGDDEASDSEVSIKPLREAVEQIRVGLNEAVALLKQD